jgi:NagD protein
MAEAKNYLIDMDGVLVRGTQVIPGAVAFIERLKARGAKFLMSKEWVWS